MVLNSLVYIALVIIVIIIIVVLLKFLLGVLFVAPIEIEGISPLGFNYQDPSGGVPRQ
jgi:hypothetical protein